MSLRLYKTPYNPDIDPEDDGESEPSSNNDVEEMWSDWVSDSMAKQPCKLLFEEKTLPSVAEALEYNKGIHDFDLNAFCAKLGASRSYNLRLTEF